MKSPLAAFLDTLHFGEPIARDGLAVYPLVGLDDRPPDYLTLPKALASGLASVREVSEAGLVNALYLVNRASLPILVLDGDILVGAKQNRVVNVSMLAPALSDIRVPVSCVEQGRWSYQAGREFGASENSFKAASRARKAERVSINRQARGEADADQQSVWEDVRDSLDRTGAADFAFTLDMECAYASCDDALRGLAGAFRPQANQCGAVFASEDRLLGIDAFDSPRTFADVLPRLIRGYGIEVLERRGGPATAGRSDRGAAARFLAALKITPIARYPSAGLGEELHGVSEFSGVSALLLGDRVIHLFGYARGEARRASPR